MYGNTKLGIQHATASSPLLLNFGGKGGGGEGGEGGGGRAWERGRRKVKGESEDQRRRSMNSIVM